MRLRYTPEARTDLRELRRYIGESLGNPGAAARISGEIIRDCSRLKQFPELGMELCRKIDVETDLRYLICNKHFAFYRIEKAYISVTRILDGRTDYLRVLFGDEIGDADVAEH